MLINNLIACTYMSRVALVTGATQGLGLALVADLAARLNRGDVVYLTGRDRGRVEQAAAALPASSAEVRTSLLDVSSNDAVESVAGALAERHGHVDLVLSNAYSRVVPRDDPAAVVSEYVETNNLGTTRMLRAFAPLLGDRSRLIVVASTLGTLHYLAPVLHQRFDDLDTLEDVDTAVLAWCAAVRHGNALPEGWPGFINIPSKIAQVSAVRTLARARRRGDVEREILIAAVCPGMIDTGASRPWFDMSRSQTPAQAAAALVDFALESPFDPALYGELVRFGKVLPWKP
jgi:carbonyl reductase 1